LKNNQNFFNFESNLVNNKSRLLNSNSLLNVSLNAKLKKENWEQSTIFNNFQFFNNTVDNIFSNEIFLFNRKKQLFTRKNF
jgi:hypothetical protein